MRIEENSEVKFSRGCQAVPINSTTLCDVYKEKAAGLNVKLLGCKSCNFDNCNTRNSSSQLYFESTILFVLIFNLFIKLF